VVAEIADAAGVFDVAGHWAARAGRGRTWLLWLLIVGLSCLSTIVLSLDTTAVLLTPVVITVARQLRLNPLPFAMTTVWLANTASLLLPVSNLTNLLALHRFSALGLGHKGYISLALWPALAAIAATVCVLAVIHARDLRGRYSPEAPPRTARPDLADRGRVRMRGARPRLRQRHHPGHPRYGRGAGAGRQRHRDIRSVAGQRSWSRHLQRG